LIFFFLRPPPDWLNETFVAAQRLSPHVSSIGFSVTAIAIWPPSSNAIKGKLPRGLGQSTPSCFPAYWCFPRTRTFIQNLFFPASPLTYPFVVTNEFFFRDCLPLPPRISLLFFHHLPFLLIPVNFSLPFCVPAGL